MGNNGAELSAGEFLLHMVCKFPGMCNPTGSAICINATQGDVGDALHCKVSLRLHCKYFQTKGETACLLSHTLGGKAAYVGLSFLGNKSTLQTPERWMGEPLAHRECTQVSSTAFSGYMVRIMMVPPR